MPPRNGETDAERTATTVRVRCDHCRSRLDVIETQSGGRTVSVVGLGSSVEAKPIALERFELNASARDVTCPACNHTIDPYAPYRAMPPLSRRS
jgi:DNA-directed RNA polymerase subunit RPC12/RpoP